MKNITIENASIVATFNGVSYELPYVTNVTLANPQENQLSVSPQNKGDGIVYRINTTTPTNNDFIVRDLPVKLYELFTNSFNNGTRFDLLILDTQTDRRYEANRGICRTDPRNTVIVEGESSLDVSINTLCPPNRWNHKLPAENAEA